MSIAEESFERINCHHIGAWLESTLQGLKQPLPPASLRPDAFHATDRAAGIVFTLSCVAEPAPFSTDALFLSRVECDATVPMPLGLDPSSETITSAGAKLSKNVAGGSQTDIEAGDRRVSYFMDDGRVVELRFNDGLKGFDRILLARLGAPLDWRDVRWGR